MKQKNIFALKITSTVAAAAILLAGCSVREESIDSESEISSVVDTSGALQPENSGNSISDTSAEGSEPSEESKEESVESSSAIQSTVTSSTSTTTSVSSSTTTTTTSSSAKSSPSTTESSSSASKSSTTTTTTSSSSSVKSSTSTTTLSSASKSSSTTSSSSAKSSSSTKSSSSSAASSTKSSSSTSSSAAEPEVITPAIDPDEVYRILISFKNKYPEGMPWTNENRSYKSYTILPQYSWYEGRGCAAFAIELSDAAFGSLPAKEHHNISDIRVGDILRIDNNSHSVIVLEVCADGVVIAEGNYNSSVHWGRKLSTSELQKNLTYIWTRYP